MIEDKNIRIARLISLEKKTRDARSQEELNFVISNETRQIIDFVNSFLLLKTPAGKFEIKATSDMPSVDRTSPLITFIENIVNKKSKINIKELKYFKTDEISASIKVKRPRSIPDNILFIPIISPQRGLQGFLLLTRNTKFLENDIELARHLSATYGHAYNSFK